MNAPEPRPTPRPDGHTPADAEAASPHPPGTGGAGDPPPGDPIAAEFEHHLALAADELEAMGMDSETAERVAAERFGDAQRYRRKCLRHANWSHAMKSKLMVGFAGVLIGACLTGGLAAVIIADLYDEMEERTRWEVAQSLGLRDWKHVGPFSGWVWLGEREAAVLVDGRWYRLEAVNDHSVDRLLAAASEAFGQNEARKRVSEDIYEVLTVAEDHAPSDYVDLVLTDPETGEHVTLQDVEMTHDKRQSARWARWKETEGAPQPPGGAFDFMERRG